jgi:hypothetical protein
VRTIERVTVVEAAVVTVVLAAIDRVLALAGGEEKHRAQLTPGADPDPVARREVSFEHEVYGQVRPDLDVLV